MSHIVSLTASYLFSPLPGSKSNDTDIVRWHFITRTGDSQMTKKPMIRQQNISFQENMRHSITVNIWTTNLWFGPTVQCHTLTKTYKWHIDN